jgi:hypothetical protein
MKIQLFIILFISLNIVLKAQFVSDSLEFKNDSLISEKNVYLSLNFSPFLRNNEYFNELYDGITFIGVNLNPYLSYKFNKKLLFHIGWYGRLFNGRADIYINKLFYRCTYNFNNNLKFIMGYIYGYEFHHLIEPLYSTDYFYFNKPETGLQFLYNNDHFKSDLWLNWEKFILPGDNYKEEFIIGNSSKIRLTNKFSHINVVIPLNFVAKHKGGQIEINTSPLQTYFNWAIGTDVSLRLNKKTYGINNYYVQFNDVSPYKILRYTDGFGIYTNLYVLFPKIEIYSGFWHGEYYFSPIGEPLYMSLSKKYVFYEEPEKNLILFKLRFKQLEFNNTFIAFQVECYYDYKRNYFDYSYGVSIKLSEKYLLKKLTFE